MNVDEKSLDLILNTLSWSIYPTMGETKEREAYVRGMKFILETSHKANETNETYGDLKQTVTGDNVENRLENIQYGITAVTMKMQLLQNLIKAQNDHINALSYNQRGVDDRVKDTYQVIKEVKEELDEFMSIHEGGTYKSASEPTVPYYKHARRTL